MVSSVFGGMTGMREEPEQEEEEGERRAGGGRAGDAISEEGGDGSKKQEVFFYSSKSTSDPSSSKAPGGGSLETMRDESPANGITPGLEVPEFPLPPSTRPSLDDPSLREDGVSQPLKRKLSPAEAIAAQVREDDLLRASSPMSALPPATASAPPGDGDGRESRILDSHDGAGSGGLVGSPATEEPRRQPSVLGASTPPERVSSPPRPALLVSPPSDDRLKAHIRQASIDRDLPPLPPTASAPNSETTIVPTTPTRTTPSSVLFASALLSNHASNLHTTASSLNQRAQDLSYASNEMLKHGKRLLSSSSSSSLTSGNREPEEEDPVKMLESSAILHRAGREMMEEAIRLSGRALEVAERKVKGAKLEQEKIKEGWEVERAEWRREKEIWEGERRKWEEEKRKEEEEPEREAARRRSQRSLPFGSVGRSFNVGGLDGRFLPFSEIFLVSSVARTKLIDFHSFFDASRFCFFQFPKTSSLSTPPFLPLVLTLNTTPSKQPQEAQPLLLSPQEVPTSSTSRPSSKTTKRPNGPKA